MIISSVLGDKITNKLRNNQTTCAFFYKNSRGVRKVFVPLQRIWNDEEYEEDTDSIIDNDNVCRLS